MDEKNLLWCLPKQDCVLDSFCYFEACSEELALEAVSFLAVRDVFADVRLEGEDFIKSDLLECV